MGGADKVFIATEGPEGWQLGRWTQASSILWEEKKADGTVVQYADCGKSATATSQTARLKGQMDGQAAELLILDTSIQVISGGAYVGEFLGHWEGAGAPQPRAPPAPAAQKAPTSPQQIAHKEAAPRATRPQKKSNCDKNPDMVEKLYQACKAGDDFACHKFLEQPVDPDGVSPSENMTPLMAATGQGRVKIVELLLKYGADVNKDVDGATAMIMAHQKGKKDVLRVLFGAAFQSLEATVGGGLQAGGTTQRRHQEEDIDDESHWRDLREVTAKLAHLNNKESDSKEEYKEMSVSFEETQQPNDDDDHGRLREEVVRDTMKALLNASKHN